MRKVNKNSKIPLYYQLKDIICGLIENEELKPNDPIPPERELCVYHGVSRMTVNKAISNLVNEGVLYREQGRGTFVAEPKESYQLTRLLSFTEDMKAKKLKLDTKILSFLEKRATPKIEKLFALPRSQRVYEIKRVRIVEGEPYAVETAYIPVHFCKGLSAEELSGNSLYDILQKKYGLVMEYAHQTIEAVMPDEYVCRILQLPQGSIALMLSRKTFDRDDALIEFTRAIYRGDKYKFEVVLHR